MNAVREPACQRNECTNPIRYFVKSNIITKHDAPRTLLLKTIQRHMQWKCGRICCLKAIKHRMHLHRLLICTISVCFTKLPTPCRRSLRFLRPKIRTLEKMSTRFPLQSPLFLLGLFLLLLVDGRSICCSRACLFWRIKPLAIAAAMSQKQGC